MSSPVNTLTHYPVESFGDLSYREQGVKLSEELSRHILAKLEWFKAKRASGVSFKKEALKCKDADNGTEYTLSWRTPKGARSVKMHQSRKGKWVLRGSQRDKHLWLQALCVKGELTHREFVALSDEFPTHLREHNTIKPVTLDF